MSTAHTPGPWEVERRRGTITDEEYPEVVGFRVSASLYRQHRETVKANARLIAAAPDLLAALHRLTTQMDDAISLMIESEGEDDPLAVALQGDLEPVRALLARIDGEAEASGPAQPVPVRTSTVPGTGTDPVPTCPECGDVYGHHHAICSQGRD